MPPSRWRQDRATRVRWPAERDVGNLTELVISALTALRVRPKVHALEGVIAGAIVTTRCSLLARRFLIGCECNTCRNTTASALAVQPTPLFLSTLSALLDFPRPSEADRCAGSGHAGR